MPRITALLLCLLTSLVVADTRENLLGPDELRADFEQLRSELYASHIDAFADRSRAELDRHFRTLLPELAQAMPREQAALIFQRWVAFGNVAHARVEDAGLAFVQHINAGGGLLPFDIRVQDGEFYISETYPGGEALRVGDRMVEIDGRSISEFRAALHEELSADNAYLANTLIELDFPRVAWQRLGSLSSVPMKIERQGESIEVEIESRPLDSREAAADPDRLRLSWSRRDAGMQSCRTAYLRPGPFYNPDGEMWDTSAFRSFIDEAFADFIEQGAERLVIDLRNNPGGDASFSDHLLAWIADEPFRFYSRFEVRNSPAARAANARRLEGEHPNETSLAYAEAYEKHDDGAVFEFERPFTPPRDGEGFDGEVFVLVNRHSYSNAVTTAMIIQDYGFGTILGEPTADLATTLGAMEHFTLRHSGLRVGFPKARIVRPNGDERRLGVQPDQRIATPLIESADDPVLQSALRIACGQAD
ncbi:S41 family peptidase [Wenzhouxiangella marina]|uniref:Uncharacterized protein n=1 Tax=Wenzhouxiangella marina TaxID=1579979 RepID=A0A0K0XW76_9GAMM|nr:S41 family peptidase [Wenzhouxiangella marina]AKS41871.1 hypothetical protein WM2015_1500 [Wenzhouxiangella marina]MBB6086363.1 C-terminal processing protease CtpA/Prc [Wenzhouxiangella marina]